MQEGDKFYCKSCQLVFPEPTSPPLSVPITLSTPSKRLALAKQIAPNWEHVAMALDIEPKTIRIGFTGTPSELNYSFAFLTSLAERGTTTANDLAKVLVKAGYGGVVTPTFGFPPEVLK